MDVMDLRRRKAMKLKSRILRAEIAQKIFVPLKTEVWMQTALHQNPRATECYRFIDLLTDFIERANVSVRCAGTTVESAEGAHNITDVRVIDVAVNDVSDEVVRMPARP